MSDSDKRTAKNALFLLKLMAFLRLKLPTFSNGLSKRHLFFANSKEVFFVLSLYEIFGYFWDGSMPIPL